jgi:hypothetical protein
MCVGVTVWFGWGGVVSGCRLKHLLTFIGIYRSILLRMRNVSENFVERIKTYFMFKNCFLKITPFLIQSEKK